MKTRKWLLQLFADGEGGAAATGEAGADAGHQGQPDGEAAQEQTERAMVSAEPTGQDAAAGQTSNGRMTWEQIKADPEYSRQLQNLVRGRLKNAKHSEAALEALQPALRYLARQLGLQEGEQDYSALSQAAQLQQQKADRQARQQEQQLQQHYRGLLQQARQLKKRYPGFDLHRELQNPAFARLTAPHVGVCLEDAYYTVHRADIEAAAVQVAAQRAAQQVCSGIRSGSMRPVENGTAGEAPSVISFDYKNASRSQREALKSRIRQAGARGEKFYPGQ